MKVSVIICTYSEDMYEHFQEAVESIRSQTHDDVELILIVDGNETLCQQVKMDYGKLPEVKIHCNDKNIGLSASRNNGLAYVTGDVIAFIDDDAVAEEQWVEELVSVYKSQEAIAVGGKMTPIWTTGKPQFLPSEFYWLVGVTHRGFAEPGQEVRNTFGSNISFRREVFEEVGKFDPELGRHGSLNIQAEETIFCVRMREFFDRGVVYNPDAVVAHKIFDYRTEPKWLLERAFWQGYSKQVMEQLTEGGGDNETTFLKQLFCEFIPARLSDLIRSPTASSVLQLLAIGVFTAAVGAGYGYGLLKSLVSSP